MDLGSAKYGDATRPSDARRLAEHERGARDARETIAQVVVWILLVSGLTATSRYNYLLFHTMIELTAVAVAWGLFLLIWNDRFLGLPAGPTRGAGAIG